MVYLSNEILNVPIEVANYGGVPLSAITPSWKIKNASGKVVFEGLFGKRDVPVGNCINIGYINQKLETLSEPGMLTVEVSVEGFSNSWDIFVYPASIPPLKENILVTQTFDANAVKELEKGGTVLLTLKKGSVKQQMGGNVAVGFSSIFWNTAWTNGQAPHTLGILCDPSHPALSFFPTQYHSNWQWWDAMTHSNAIRLDSISRDIKPIVRIIDDWVTARPLGLIFECSVDKGKLLVSGIDLLSNKEVRPEARQMLFSLKSYMSGEKFQPKAAIDKAAIERMLK
jgi:hypothetical protein